MVGPSPVLAHVAQDVVLGHRLVLVVVDPDRARLLLVPGGIRRIGSAVQARAASVVIGMIELMAEQRLVGLRVVHAVLVLVLRAEPGSPLDGAVRSGSVRHRGLRPARDATAVRARFGRGRFLDRGRVAVRLQVVDQLVACRRRVQRRQRLQRLVGEVGRAGDGDALPAVVPGVGRRVIGRRAGVVAVPVVVLAAPAAAAPRSLEVARLSRVGAVRVQRIVVVDPGGPCGGAARVDADHGALDRDAHGRDLDEAAAHLEHDRRHALDGHRARVDLLRAGCVVLRGSAHLQVDGSAGRRVDLAIAAQVDVALDVDVVAAAHRQRVLATDPGVACAADGLVHAALDAYVHPALRVDEDLLLVLLVLEAQLVEAVAAGRRVALDVGQRLEVGQLVERHVLAVVDAADDDRLVRVAFEELDHDLLADARDGDEAPALAGPRMRDAEPAGAVLVALALAVPVELDLHAAVLVGEDLLAGRPDDRRGLHAYDDRGVRATSRTVGHGGGDALELVGVGDRGGAAARPVALARAVLARGEEVAAVERLRHARALRPHAERESRRERACGARAATEDPGRVLLLLADPHDLVVPGARHGAGRMVVDLVGAVVVAGRGRRQVQGRLLEVVVGRGPLAGPDLLLLREPGDDVLFLGGGRLLLHEANGRQDGAGDVSAGVIGEDERVLALLVIEEEADALLLEEAGDEVVVGLAVLHAVLARIVGAGQLEAVVAEPVLAEELLQDVRHGLALEDAAVGGPGEEPEPGGDVGTVVGMIRHRARLREAADDAVDEPGSAARADRHGDARTDDRIEVGTLVAPEQLRLEAKEG